MEPKKGYKIMYIISFFPLMYITIFSLHKVVFLRIYKYESVAKPDNFPDIKNVFLWSEDNSESVLKIHLVKM